MSLFRPAFPHSHQNTRRSLEQRIIAGNYAAELSYILFYIIALALIATTAFHIWKRSGVTTSPAVTAPQGWSEIQTLRSAFSLAPFNGDALDMSTHVLRHPEGGRRDLLAWSSGQGGHRGEIELYRPGQETPWDQGGAETLAERMDAPSDATLVQTGTISSKFGPVTLYVPTPGNENGETCLAFRRMVRGTNVQMSGWACQDAKSPALARTLACAIDHVSLLAAGGDKSLAEAFAAAERSRGDCRDQSPMTADWVTGTRAPTLRGTL